MHNIIKQFRELKKMKLLGDWKICMGMQILTDKTSTTHQNIVTNVTLSSTVVQQLSTVHRWTVSTRAFDRVWWQTIHQRPVLAMTHTCKHPQPRANTRHTRANTSTVNKSRLNWHCLVFDVIRRWTIICLGKTLFTLTNAFAGTVSNVDQTVQCISNGSSSRINITLQLHVTACGA